MRLVFPSRILYWLLLVATVYMQGCTCCAYFNHMWNAHRAYDEATELREARLDSLPGDTAMARNEELAKYNRVIEKGSRTLERFPENQRQASMAIFLIAEAHRHKSEWAKAVGKYDELERYFPQHDSMPKAEYQRAWCLYKNKEYSISRFAVDRLLEKGPTHPYHSEALNLLALLHEQANFPEQAIAALEQVLQSGHGTPYMRGKAHLRLAELYFRQESWEPARLHYQAKEIELLTVAERFMAGKQAAECLFHLNQWASAAQEYTLLAQNLDFAPYLADIQVRRGELLLMAGNEPDGRAQLQICTRLYPKTEYSARAYFHLGDFEQTTLKNYPAAIAFYDSSYQEMASSHWGRTSRERRDALSRLGKLKDNTQKAQKARQPFFEEDFQIAELFLFRLSETDSALATLNRIATTATDTALAQRAAYAQAFVYDEFKKDTLRADSLYKDIIQRYPHSDYARQAQINLGEKVTVQTRSDQAYQAYLRAENAWLAAQNIPVDQIEAIDTAYSEVLALYDSVYILYPETNAGVQALYAKAYLLETELADIEAAKVAYDRLRTQHRSTPWGQSAELKMSGRLTITDKELEQLRRRVQLVEESTLESRKRYENTSQKKQELKIKAADPDEEVLESDYNSLYDFE